MNLKFLIFLTLKSFFIINRQINCPSFKCSIKGMKDKKCFSSIEEYSDGEIKSTVYLSQFKKEEKCTQASWDPSIRICSTNIRKSLGGKHANPMQIFIVKHAILTTIIKIKK